MRSGDGFVYCTIASDFMEAGRLLWSSLRQPIAGLRGSSGRLILTFLLVLGLARLVGYAVQALLAYFFGTQHRVDVFVAASALPDLLGNMLVGGLLAYAVIPASIRLQQTGGPAAAERLLGATLTQVLLIAGGLTLLILLFAEPLIALIAPSLTGHDRALAVTLFRICAPSVLFYALASLAAASLNIRRRFLPAPVSVLIGNVAALLVFATAPWIGITAAAWSYTATSVCMAVVQWGAAWRAGIRLRPNFDTAPMRLLLTTGSAAAMLAAAPYIRIFIERALASSLPPGELAALNFAVRIVFFTMSLVAMPIATIAFPDMVDEAVVDARGMRALQRGVAAAVTLGVPAALLLILFSGPIVGVLLEHGAFGSSARATTAPVLSWYAAGLVPAAVNELLVRTLLAAQRHRAAALAAVGTLMVSVAIDVALLHRLGVVGLAMGAAAGAWLGSGLFWSLVRPSWRRTAPTNTTTNQV